MRAFLWCMKTQRKTRKLVSLVAILVLHLSGVSIANAEVFSTISVTGRVLPAFLLEIGQPTPFDTNVAAAVEQTSANATVVELSVLGTGEAATIVIPLRMRTNANGYVLRASVRGPLMDGEVSLSQPQPTGNATLVMPDAVFGFQTQPTRLATDMIIAAGPRISMRGSFRSPNNALESTMEIHLDPIPRGEARTLLLLLTAETQ